jgi:hypothetical protein
MPTDPTGRPGILVALDVLVVDGPTAPRPLDSAATALDRLNWIGRPVVMAGHELVGRRLPEAADERVAWVRAAFGKDDLDVHPFEEPGLDRAGELSASHAVERWTEVRDAWGATWLLTSRITSVGPARRAGLAVVRIGPRPDGAAAVERADHEARDLLDAASHLLASDAFATKRSPG